MIFPPPSRPVFNNFFEHFEQQNRLSQVIFHSRLLPIGPALIRNLARGVSDSAPKHCAYSRLQCFCSCAQAGFKARKGCLPGRSCGTLEDGLAYMDALAAEEASLLKHLEDHIPFE